MRSATQIERTGNKYVGVHPAVIVVFHVCRTGFRVFKGVPFDFAFASSRASRGFSAFDTCRVLRGPAALLRILDRGRGRPMIDIAGGYRVYTHGTWPGSKSIDLCVGEGHVLCWPSPG